MSTALYRRYRPESFADVIGQEHVTEPLMAAIDKDRINHAYLFSGPRGCGKTTSARILARCLNCAQGPTSTPCGVCDSCVELARNGSGSLDVIEIDAASHGGVDDARDLRERATFAPVRDRFKIFIIDEAHMVTSAGFNALLKIVEEPPEHILFIFATTEPDKVIGTIRSRTHHYPFRLVPPEPLMAYLESLCHQENVPVAPGVLSLVVRAGGGSVRDSLSVLDQLMAGASETGLDYELAVSLLGYTHATLLDDVVDSVAAGDAATVFNAVDRVIQTGHDPRRFVEDLLERFRDLIVINAVPEGAASILRGVPDDQLNRMRTQANQLGAGELSRAADVTNAALNEMTGATSPRLHLELLCARLLLPAADASVRGTLARVDRIERRLEYAAGTPGSDGGNEPAAASGPVAAAEPPKAPARPRLDGVPRTAEEAAARWSLPVADPAGPAVPAAATSQQPPAVRDQQQPGTPVKDSSPDWGGNWGVSTDSAFAHPEPDTKTAAPPAAGAPGTSGDSGNSGTPGAPAPAGTSGVPGGAGTPGATPAPGAPTPGIPASGEDREERPTAEESGSRGQADTSRAGPAKPASSVDDDSRRTGDQAPQASGEQRQQAQQPGSAPAQHGAGHGRQPEQPRTPAPGQQPEPGQQGQPAASGGNVEMIRRAWPEIMDEVAHIKRATWLIVNVSAKPRSFEGNQLVLAFVNQGNAIGFQRGPHMDNLKQAIHKVLGLTCSIEAVHDAGGSGESGPKVPASTAGPGSSPGPASAASGLDTAPAGPGPRGAGAAEATVPAPSPGDTVHDRSTRTPDPAGRPETGALGAQVAPASGDPAPGPAPTASATGPIVEAAGQARPAAASGPRPATGDAPAPDRGNTAAPTAAPATHRASGDAPDGANAAGPTTDSEGGVRPERDVTPAAQPATQDSGTRPVPDTDAGRSGVATPGAPAARRTSGDAPTPDRPKGTPSDEGANRGTRPAERSASASAETVGAWDPSMSDDSWALVEPPEEAFDPGPGWGSVPEDPNERPAAGPRGTGGAPAPIAPAPDRTSGRGPDPRRTGRAPTSGNPPPGGPRARPEGAADTTPQPTASRSVVWSPPVATTPPPPADDRAKPPTPGAEGTGGTEAGTAHQAGAVRTTAPVQPRKPVVPRFAAPGSASAGPTTSSAPGVASPAPSSVDRSAVPDPGAPASRGGAGPDGPTSAADVRQKPVSRYQQLLDAAERKRAEEAAAARGAVDLRFVEDEPSADDETIEESGLVGRTAIERILNGRLIEERSVDGQ